MICVIFCFIFVFVDRAGPLLLCDSCYTDDISPFGLLLHAKLNLLLKDLFSPTGVRAEPAAEVKYRSVKNANVGGGTADPAGVTGEQI